MVAADDRPLEHPEDGPVRAMHPDPAGAHAMVLLLVSDEGNERVLEQWIRNQEAYAVADLGGRAGCSAVDLCVVDLPGLREHRDTIENLQADAAPALLPVLLLLPDRDADLLASERDLSSGADERTVTEVVSLPIRKAELAWRFETLLSLREHSLDLEEQAAELRLFREAADAAGHAIYITDEEGTIEYVNPAFEAITGWDRPAVLGETPRLLQSGEHDDRYYRTMWETITRGEQWHGEIVDARKDGDPVVLEQTISPVIDEAGEPRKFVAVAQDVTERKRAEQRVEAQRDDLELLHRVLRHDIRNDLQLITANAEMLDGHVEPEVEGYLAALESSAQEAVALTESARDLANVILQLEVENTTMDLRSVLQEQLEEARSSHGDAEIRLEGTIPAVDVVADTMLHSTFRNLLNNAVLHNDTDAPVVSVSAHQTDDRVVTRVADNGPGVSDARKDEIFGKGEKGLDSGGTGVGLYLVRSLVDKYGGEVRVEDNDPRGARFVVELPVAA